MVEGIGMDARDSSRHVAEEPSAGALLDALPIEPIPKRQNLRNQVADQITELIVSGALPAGTRLTELGMAERLGVSRVPVREAFLILQGDQWVDIQESHGAKVHVPHPSEVENIYEVRMALESSAAALACRAADDAAIAELSTMANYGREVFLKDGGGDVKLISNVNERFHDRIAQLSGNPILRRMIDLMIKKPVCFSPPISRILAASTLGTSMLPSPMPLSMARPNPLADLCMSIFAVPGSIITMRSPVSRTRSSGMWRQRDGYGRTRHGKTPSAARDRTGCEVMGTVTRSRQPVQSMSVPSSGPGFLLGSKPETI